MNEVIVIGRLIKNIEYKFIINGKKNALASFFIELNNKSVVECKAYDFVADYCYRKLKENMVVIIYGKFRTDKECYIEVESFEQLNIQ